MALDFDADKTSLAIIELLQIAYIDEPGRAAFGALGPKGDMPIAPCSQIGVMSAADGEYLLAAGFGALRIPIRLELSQLRALHAELSALFAAHH
jgi:hypothetical protein